MLDYIAPPKPRRVGRKRTVKVSAKTETLKEKYVKAKRSAKRTLNAENRKVEKAREKYVLAQRKAKTKKEKVDINVKSISGIFILPPKDGERTDDSA